VETVNQNFDNASLAPRELVELPVDVLKARQRRGHLQSIVAKNRAIEYGVALGEVNLRKLCRLCFERISDARKIIQITTASAIFDKTNEAFRVAEAFRELAFRHL
jgi:hypothetical protein